MQFKTETYKPLLHWLHIIFFAVAILYFGKALFVPLSFLLLIAIILYPSIMWLEKRHRAPQPCNSYVAVSCYIIFTAVVWLLLWQLNYLKDEYSCFDRETESMPAANTATTTTYIK